MKKIGGEAKAMLVTASRLHAVRYKLAFDAYIQSRGYTDLKTLVAFSGTVKDNELEYRETTMNHGVSESQLPAEYDKEENRVLIVANKYQTGFDQPRLHTMYVDKKLSGVKAVQTLSRLNRTYPGKEDTFILDFVNEPEDILESFQPFYRTTMLNNDIEPNDIYSLQHAIEERHIVDQTDVLLFTNLFYKDKQTSIDISIMNNCVDSAVKRTEAFERDEMLEFRGLLNRFVNFYNLIIQVAPIIDTELHRLQIYLRYLLKKLEVDGPATVDLTDKVVLQYYKLDIGREKMLEYPIDQPGVEINITGASSIADADLDPLSVIIDRLNVKYGTKFSETERLAVEQITTGLKADKDLAMKAKANTYEVFKLAFEPAFEKGIVKEYDKNQEFYGRILKDDDFRKKLMDLMMLEIYRSFREY